jgi:hypothetical protein
MGSLCALGFKLSLGFCPALGRVQHLATAIKQRGRPRLGVSLLSGASAVLRTGRQHLAGLRRGRRHSVAGCSPTARPPGGQGRA